MFQAHINSTVSDTDPRYSLIRTTPPHKRLVVVSLIVLLAVLGAGVSFYPIENNLWLTVQPSASYVDCEDVSLVGWTTPMFVASGSHESLRTLQPGLEAWVFTKPGSGPSFQFHGTVKRVTHLECAASQLTVLEIESPQDEHVKLKSVASDQEISMRIRVGDSSFANVIVSSLRTASMG